MLLFPADITDPWNEASPEPENLPTSTLSTSLYEPGSLFSDNAKSSSSPILTTQSGIHHDGFLLSSLIVPTPPPLLLILDNSSSLNPLKISAHLDNALATGEVPEMNIHIAALSDAPVNGGDSEDLISQNGDLEDLLEFIKENKVISLSSYKVLFDKFSGYLNRDDTVKLIEFIKIEDILESKYQLNQIQIENLFNYITNNPNDALRVNYKIFEILIGLAELEFEKLGEGNLSNLKQYFLKYKRFPLSANVSNEDSKKTNLNNSTSSINSSIYNNDDQSNDIFSSLDNYNLMTPDLVKVTEIPEKEGLFMKHVNYLIKHDYNFGVNTIKKVVRRYSDFIWLNDILLIKYPFRLIPKLPPKGFSGTYLHRK